MTTYELEIQGMRCDHCVRAVEKALRDIEGVRAVRVEIGWAQVEAEARVAREAIVAALHDAGYEVV
jgi:copper ion binding protein